MSATSKAAADQTAAAPTGRGVGRTRWGIISLCFGATALNYLDRANLGIALPYMSEDLGISNTYSGLLLGAFFWSYALMQFPAGWLVDRYGPRKMLAIAVALWSLMTMFMGAASGFMILIVLRLLLGVGESPAYPSSAKVVSRWFPAKERGLAASIFDSGARAGTALSLPIITLLIAWVGWRGSFVVAGLLGFVFVAVWLKVYQDPEKHPKVSDAEKAYIRDGRTAEMDEAAAMPWRQLFKYRTTWGMILGFFCLSFVLYFFITWFPSYLVKERGFDLLKLGIFGMLPALCAMPAQWLGGWLQGSLIRRGRSISFARKVPLVSGLLLSSVIVFAGQATNAAVALTLLTVSYCALTFAASSLWALPADVAPTPRNVASLAGIQGFASNAAGFASPVVIGILLDQTGSFVAPLALAGAVAIVGAIAYMFVIGKIAPLGSKA